MHRPQGGEILDSQDAKQFRATLKIVAAGRGENLGRYRLNRPVSSVHLILGDYFPLGEVGNGALPMRNPVQRGKPAKFRNVKASFPFVITLAIKKSDP